MKKLIAILLTFVLLLSMAACGNKKEPASTSPADGGSQDQGGVTAPAGDNKVEDSTLPSDTAPQDATEPTGDPNKIDSVVEGNSGASGEDDSVIKVEINNSADSSDPVVVTPPDAGTENSFVIDFDQLLDASQN